MRSLHGERKDEGSRTREGVGMARKSASLPASLLELGREEPVLEQETKGQNRGHNGSSSVNYSEWYAESQREEHLVSLPPPLPASHFSFFLYPSLYL